MHLYVPCSTVHNSKDMESTQMPISDRVNKENVVYIHHGILCIHKKEENHILYRDMFRAGEDVEKKEHFYTVGGSVN